MKVWASVKLSTKLCPIGVEGKHEVPLIIIHLPSLSPASYQLWTSWIDGWFIRFPGSRDTSLMVLAKRTGSSFLRNINEIFSQAFSLPEQEKACIQVTLIFSSSIRRYVRPSQCCPSVSSQRSVPSGLARKVFHINRWYQHTLLLSLVESSAKTT